MVLLDCPSIWEWCMMIRSNLVPRALYKLIQNREVNRRPLSDTMLEGTPCNLTTSLIYNLVSLASEKYILIGMKLTVLVSHSTITQVALFLRNIISSPVTKSMVILFNFHSRTSNCFSKLEGLWCLTLTC